MSPLVLGGCRVVGWCWRHQPIFILTKTVSGMVIPTPRPVGNGRSGWRGWFGGRIHWLFRNPDFEYGRRLIECSCSLPFDVDAGAMRCRLCNLVKLIVFLAIPFPRSENPRSKSGGAAGPVSVISTGQCHQWRGPLPHPPVNRVNPLSTNWPWSALLVVATVLGRSLVNADDPLGRTPLKN